MDTIKSYQGIKDKHNLNISRSPSSKNDNSSFIAKNHHAPGKGINSENLWKIVEDNLLLGFHKNKHPFLNQAIISPEQAWESTVNPKVFPYIYDYIENNMPILTSATYIEAALALNNLINSCSRQGLLNLKFHHPLVIAENEQTEMCVLYHQQKNEFGIYSRASNKNNLWTRHASGNLWSGELDLNHSVNIEDIRLRCSKKVNAKHLYRQLSNQGLQYGPWLQGIQKLWTGKDEVLAEIKGYKEIANEKSNYHIHPTLLDACFQSLQYLLISDRNATYTLTTIDNIAVVEQLPERFFVHGTLLNHPDSTIGASLELLDKKGRRLAKLNGLGFKTLTTAKHQFDNTINNLLYQYQWQKAKSESVYKIKRNGHWLIFDDKGVIVERLHHKLINQIKGTITHVTAGDSFQQHSNGYQIRPGLLEDYHTLLNNIPDLSGIAYFWGSGQSNLFSLAAISQRETSYLLNLIKSLQSNRLHHNSRLYIVTRGAQQVVDNDTMLANPQWSFIGLNRVAFCEAKNHDCTLIDIDPVNQNVNIELLHNELLSDYIEDEVALRKEQRYLHLLQRIKIDSLDEESKSSQPKTVPSNRSYQIMLKRGHVFFEQSIRRCPEPDQIEIELHSVALTQQDCVQIQESRNVINSQVVSFANHKPHGYTGIVTRIGSRVADIQVGDQLVGYAKIDLNSFIILSVKNLCAIKTNHFINSELPNSNQLSAIPEEFIPAYYALSHKASLNHGDTLLIYGINSEYAKAAVQIAKLSSASILVASDKDEWINEPEYSMISAFVNPYNINFIQDIKKITHGDGVSIILNLSPNSSEHNLSKALSPFGQLINLSDTASHKRMNPLSDLVKSTVTNTSYIKVDTEHLIDRPLLLNSLLTELMERFYKNELFLTNHPQYPSNRLNEAIKSISEHSKPSNTIVTFQDHPTLDIFYRPKIAKLVKPDVSYLITDGLSDLGAEVAKWLVSKGATELILCNSQGAYNSKFKLLVKKLENRGAKVLSLSSDVAQKTDVEGIFSQINNNMSPLYGIFHTTDLDNEIAISELDQQNLKEVMSVKLKGAWNLHMATLRTKLKYFIMLSSASSMIGNKLQGREAAANSFLDQLAIYRRSENLPATSLKWDRTIPASQFQSNDAKILSTDYILDVFNRINHYQPTQIAIMNIDWDLWSQHLDQSRSSSRMIKLVKKDYESNCLDTNQALINQLKTLNNDDPLELFDYQQTLLG